MERVGQQADLLAAGILLLFAIVGETLLAYLGISLAAVRTAGGILLLLIGIDMVFARPSGGITTTDETRNDLRGTGSTTLLTALNNGDGVEAVSGDDFSIALTSGTTFNIDISSATTVQDVLDTINSKDENPFGR